MKAGNLVPDYCSGYVAVLIAVMSSPRPTLPEVAEHTGLVKSTVQHHLEALRRDGLVMWEDGRKGTLRATCQVVPLCRG